MVTANRRSVDESNEARSVWRPSASATPCPRCGGLMVDEQLIDQPAQRCIQCGEVIDPVIVHNRRLGLSVGIN